MWVRTAGDACSVITPVHLGVFMRARVCVPRQKQRNPNTHSRISINITGCQSTSNNAAVIYDNINTSSCRQPEETATGKSALSEPGLALTIKGDFARSAPKKPSARAKFVKSCRWNSAASFARGLIKEPVAGETAGHCKHREDSKSQRSVLCWL